VLNSIQRIYTESECVMKNTAYYKRARLLLFTDVIK